MNNIINTESESDDSFDFPYLYFISGSIEDYNSLKNLKADFYEGMIMIQSSGTVLHEECFMKLAYHLYGHIQKFNLGWLFGPRLIVSLGRDAKFQPDLFFISGANKGILQDHEFIGIPDAIIEIATETTENYDKTAKRNIYRDFFVPEIIILDLKNKSLTVDTLTPRGYATQNIYNNIYTSKIISNFLWQPEFWGR